MTKGKELTVKKHVNAVHIRGELSLVQRKLANALLYHAYPLLPVQDRYEIKISHLCELIGFDSKNLEPLKDALRGLRDAAIEWGVHENGKTTVWGVSSLLSSAQIDAKSGICRYAYDPFLREKLYNPEIYATINLDIQKKFGSKHALALYENCVRYRGVGSTGWITLEVFRQLIGCDEKPTYHEFTHLNNLVIKPAVREVNETSDIEVTPEYKRQSRKVQAVRVKITDKRDLPPLKARKTKTKPAEAAARIATMAEEVAAKEAIAKDKEAAEQALREMKAIFRQG